MAKSYGPAELIHVLTIRPRPDTSRNETGSGTLSPAKGSLIRLPLFWATERAAPNESALPNVVANNSAANSSLVLVFTPTPQLVATRSFAEFVGVQRRAA